MRISMYLVLLGTYGFIASLWDLQYAVPEMVGGAALATVVLAVIGYLAAKRRISFSPAMILFLAACCRLLFVFHPVSLSDDIFRYLFDGRQLLFGVNPYTLSPVDAARFNVSLVALAEKVNHPELVTIYPPAAQLLFAAGALSGSVTGMKLFLIGLDLFLILLILRLLSALDLPPWRAIFYAWHPLSVIEIAASGHIDGAGIFFVFLALCACFPRPRGGKDFLNGPADSDFTGNRVFLPFTGGVVFSIAVLVKLLPVVFLPGYLRLSRGHGRWLFLLGFVIGCLLLILPFLPDIRNSFATLQRYGATWEFSGFLFRSLRNLFSSGKVARVMLGVLFVLVVGWCHGRAGVGRNTTSTSSEMLLEVLKTGYFISLCFLLLTPTLHPWYALYLLAFLPFCPEVAGIVLSWSVLLGYRVLIAHGILKVWQEDSGTSLMIWAAPVAAFLLLQLTTRSHLFFSRISRAR
ncbi:MAG: glycosyltransferase 87 family protein [Pseudomonadota bacterium]